MAIYPPNAEFEEKEYEIPLLFELLGTPGQIWSPGQVLEATLGVDSMLDACTAYWQHVKRQRKPGATIQGVLLAAGLMNFPQPPPRLGFSMNLLIQIKRCQYYSPRGAPASPYCQRGAGQWHRFSIKDRQQRVLSSIARQLSAARRRVAVADISYAAPCFHTRRDLWTHTRGRGLIQNSTFPRVQRLSNHRHWAYIVPGASGVALSEAEEVQDSNLLKRLSILALESHAMSHCPGILKQLQFLDCAIKAGIRQGEGNLIDCRPSVEHRTRSTESAAALTAKIAANLAVNDIYWFCVGIGAFKR